MLATLAAEAQVFTNKVVGEKNQSKRDSLKNSEYPYTLPIWGAKATQAGYDLPYSAGISTQYFWQESDIIIDNLMIGFNGGQMVNVDDVIRFNKAILMLRFEYGFLGTRQQIMTGIQYRFGL